MRYLLDTSACVDYLRGRHALLVQRIQTSPPQDLVLSTIVVAELRFGAEKSARRRQNHDGIDRLVDELTIVLFDEDAALHFGHIRTELQRHGTVIGPYDMLIAAHARALGVVLVTDNEEEFRRVADLQVENWRVPAE